MNKYFLHIDQHKCKGCGTCQDHLDILRGKGQPSKHEQFDHLLMDEYHGKIQISEFHYQQHRETIQAILDDCQHRAIFLATPSGPVSMEAHRQ